MEISYDSNYSHFFIDSKAQINDHSNHVDFNTNNHLFELDSDILFKSNNNKIAYSENTSRINSQKPIFSLYKKKRLKKESDLKKQTKSRRNQRVGKSSLEDSLLKLVKEDYCNECRVKIEKYFKLLIDDKRVNPDKYEKIHFKENDKDARILTEASKKKGALIIKQGISKNFLELVNKKILIVFAFTILAVITLFSVFGYQEIPTETKTSNFSKKLKIYF